MEASERMVETLERMAAKYGREAILWRRSKGLGGAAVAGRQSPVPSSPKACTVLFTDRRGNAFGADSKFYVTAETADENSLGAPDKQWDLQLVGEQERMPVTSLQALGAETTAWWRGRIESGNEDPA